MRKSRFTEPQISEAKPLRMSVTPAASQSRVLLGTGITSSALEPVPAPTRAASDPPPRPVARPTA